MSVFPSVPFTLAFSVLAAFSFRKHSSFAAIQLSLLTEALIIFFLVIGARVVYACHVYPKYRSRLRHLPRPPSKPSLIMGHFWQMMEAGPGNTLRSWANSVPNQGIIRYLDFFNLERIAVVNPAALADVLVHKCYDFEKPPQLRKGISRILGLGLFLAEGEVHTVSSLSWCRCQPRRKY